MSRQSQNITKYFRSAVSAQANTGLDFKNEPFFIIEASQLLEGRIHSETCEKVFTEANKGSNYEDNKFKKTTINVIVSAKTVKTIYEANAKIQDDVDELTGLFFVPAKMDNNGKLYFDSENKKLPWFPREYLQPMVEPKLAIGSASNVDSFISDHVDQVELIGTWAQYVSFIKEFYENITNSKFEDSNILSQEEESTSFDLERNMYLFIDNTVSSTFHILKLYNYLLQDLQLKPLYDNFTSISKVISESLISNSTSNMQLHAGQMGGEHPLSPSQREAINHYNHMNVGEVLAVNGPPGTGKTTLLQSIVADTYVKRAILEEKAPLIVATSTNNQAVTNIIASFGNIKKMSDSNLEDRWIEGVHSFATYFPSGSKVKEATNQGYQCTNNKGEYFLSDIETEANLNNSRTKIIENCSEFFNSKFNNLEECRIALHKELLFFEESKRSLLVLCDESNQFQHLDIPIDVQLKLLEEQMDHIQVRIQNIKDRVSQWEIVYSKIPFIIRFISRITKKNLKRIQTDFRLFISTDELAVLDEFMSIGRIKEIYSLQVAELGRSFVKLKDDAELIRYWIKRYNNELKTLGEHGVILHDCESTRYNISIDTVNELIDKKIRYREFWIAVHYFECRWANGEDELTEKQKGKNFTNVLTKFYSRLSMITPCLVMTFYMLPKQFLVFNEQKNTFLFNFIDLLIVDEAGQVSPEIAAGAFALAKKAVVVGDIHQIEPVWSVNKSLDKALALANGMIKSIDQFKKLEEAGLTGFGSSVMMVASKSCKYEKHDQKGLFLSEHRRCYNEIIDYCNKLVYRGNLNPMRGKGSDRKNRPLEHWPQMGYHQIATESSKKQGGSRYNEVEASYIAEWLYHHLERIHSAYPDESENNLIGVITPFKSQVWYIKAALKKKMPHLCNKISVGTVHTFQGAERNIIILSTVYGMNDGSYFIDANKSLMNVAVSRAKDHFFVFGDIRCLKDNQNSASGLIKSFIQSNPLSSVASIH